MMNCSFVLLALFVVSFHVVLAFKPVNVRSPYYARNAVTYPQSYSNNKCASLKNRQVYTRLQGMKEINDYKGKDAYQLLDIPRSADKKEIKAGYRKQVGKWHPDKFPDNEAEQEAAGLRMEKINRAWYCLGDEDRKRRYDSYGEEGVGTSAASEEQLKAAGGPGMGGFGGAGGGMGGQVDVSDIFDAFFGGQGGGRPGGSRGGGGGGMGGQRRNANAPSRGEDIQVEQEIPFMTAIFGGNEVMRVRRLEECGTCTGSGIKPGAKVKTCEGCGGQGVVNNMQRTPFGVFNNVQTCPNCRGSGQQIEEYCPTCKGRGANSETKEVQIRVPPGIENGATMRVRDAGNTGKKGGPRGDLFVNLNVKRSPKFKREGTEIYSDEEVSYTDAILGAKIMAETLDGKTEVTIPAGTQPEQRLRLRGKGAPRMGTDIRGDAYLTVKVKIPTSISGKERDLIEELKSVEDGKRKKDKGGFFSGFKKGEGEE